MEKYNPSEQENASGMIEKPVVHTRWYKKWWGVLIIVLVGLVAVFLIAMGFLIVSALKNVQLPDQGVVQNQNFDLRAIVAEDDPTYGPKDAKVVFIEFGDFECPACAASHPVVKELMKNYGDRVLFAFKDFPLVQIHPNAALAAVAGQCANEQNNFWAMFDKLYENNDALEEADLKRYALQIGLNTIQFNNCLADKKYLKGIQADFDLAFNLGLTATPTFLINDNIVKGAAPLEQFEQIIVSELNQ